MEARGEKWEPSPFVFAKSATSASGYIAELDSVKQDVRFTGKHLGRSVEVIVAV
jgi:hypothetical protein